MGTTGGVLAPCATQPATKFNMLIRIACVHFTILFWESLLHSREILSTTFCELKEDTSLIYSLSGAHLGTALLKSRRQA